MSTGCPSPEMLRAYAFGDLAPAEASTVHDHLVACTVCQRGIDGLDENADAVLRCLSAPPPEHSYTLEAEVVHRTVERLLERESSATFPARVGHYQLTGPIGRGGMGEVFRAVHTELNKTFAIKLLPPRAVDDARSRQRFRREMLAVGRVEHPNIVSATDANTACDPPYLAMELVDGVDLRRILRRGARISVADACDIVRQAAEGLQHIHECGLVHRDIKPSNLMINRKGVVKILDLGLAVLDDFASDEPLTMTRGVLGTWNYMAPEQTIDSHDVDNRTDIFALGATLYELLCGASPFAHVPSEVKDRAIREEPHRRIDALIPKPLHAIVDRMLEKERDHRFANAKELIDAITPFCDEANLRQLVLDDTQEAAASSPSPVSETIPMGSAAPTSSRNGQDPPSAGDADDDAYIRAAAVASNTPAASRERKSGLPIAVRRILIGFLLLHLIVPIYWAVTTLNGPRQADIEKDDGSQTVHSGNREATRPSEKISANQPASLDTSISTGAANAGERRLGMLHSLESAVAAPAVKRRFYVDPQSGNDDNSGRSWEAAWKSQLPFASYNYLADNVYKLVDMPPEHGVTLGPGDAVYFAPGSYTTLQLAAEERNADRRLGITLTDVKGTPDKPVRLIGLPGAVLEASIPQVTARYGIHSFSAMRLEACEHVEIQGFEVCAIDGGIDLSRCKHIKVFDCWLHDMEGWRSDLVGAVTINSCENIDVHDLLVTNPYANFRQAGSHPAGGFAIASLAAKGESDAIRVHDSKFHHIATRAGDSRPVIDASMEGGFSFHHNVVVGGEAASIRTNSRPLSLHHNLFLDSGGLQVAGDRQKTTPGDCRIEFNTLARTARFGDLDHDFSYSVGGDQTQLGANLFSHNIIVGASAYRPDCMTVVASRHADPADRDLVQQHLEVNHNVYFNPKGLRFELGRQQADSLDGWRALGFDQQSSELDPQLDGGFFPAAPKITGGYYGGNERRLAIMHRTYEIDAGISIQLHVTRGGSAEAEILVEMSAPAALSFKPATFTMAPGERTRVVVVELAAANAGSPLPFRWGQIAATAAGYASTPTWIVHQDHQPAARAVPQKMRPAPADASLEDLIAHAREQKRVVDMEGLLQTLGRIRELDPNEPAWLLRIAESEDILIYQDRPESQIDHVLNAGEALKQFIEAKQPSPIENKRFTKILVDAASAAAYQGEPNDALEYLREAIRWGFNDVKHLQDSPYLRSLNGVPEFQSILQSLQDAKK